MGKSTSIVSNTTGQASESAQLFQNSSVGNVSVSNGGTLTQTTTDYGSVGKVLDLMGTAFDRFAGLSSSSIAATQDAATRMSQEVAASNERSAARLTDAYKSATGAVNTQTVVVVVLVAVGLAVAAYKLGS